eukprot:3835870-Pyramimonas_sp.AAC.1
MLRHVATATRRQDRVPSWAAVFVEDMGLPSSRPRLHASPAQWGWGEEDEDDDADDDNDDDHDADEVGFDDGDEADDD